jgi:hypothetical protein
MAVRYRIYAYSSLRNEKQQSMDLINDTFLSDPNYAQQAANSFAGRLNQSFFMRANDWKPSIEAYEHVENPDPYLLPGGPDGIVTSYKQ